MDGKYFRRVCRHAQQAHNTTAREYKEMFGLDVKRGLLCAADREIMHDHVFTNGTVNNLKKGASNRFKKGHTFNYKRSPQTIKRLKEHGKNLPHHNFKKHENNI